MARRKKKQGTNFGSRTGGGSVDAYKKRERSRVVTYAIAGVAALVVFCFVVWLISRPGAVDTVEDETGSAEVVTDASEEDVAVDEDEGDYASDEVVVEEAAVDTSASEVVDADGFSLVPGNFDLTDIDPGDRDGYYSEMPEMIIDTSKTYEAIIITERGEMRLRLYDDLAPVTVNNFVTLALDGFYDNTTFHRVLENFMVQAGDPSGTGSGGPGYNFQDEVDNDLAFDSRGLLAMANAGPGTNGSQFFITHVPTPHLTGGHTIFGEIVDGDDVLSAIRLRNPQTDANPGDLLETIEIYVSD
ncbi:MAG: peptidylprolyl isomerase [Candidatus Promineifilaceae bacterium]